MSKTVFNRKLSQISLSGIFLYIALYVFATFFYNGGTNKNKSAIGFDWANNYWCELISPIGKNGQVNPAYPIAVAAAVVLFITLSAFWIAVPTSLISNRRIATLTVGLGIGSMIFAISMLSGVYHDLLISIAGALGVLAIFILLYCLYKTEHRFIFYLGIFCILLCLVNNYVYYIGKFLDYLPIIQKISFLFFLSWFGIVLVKVKSKK